MSIKLSAHVGRVNEPDNKSLRIISNAEYHRINKEMDRLAALEMENAELRAKISRLEQAIGEEQV